MSQSTTTTTTASNKEEEIKAILKEEVSKLNEYDPISFPPIESSKEKLLRKLKQEPLVPIGSLLTCVALVVASNHLRKGDRSKFNHALRWRVGFQGVTVAAAIAGSYYYKNKDTPVSTTTTTTTLTPSAVVASTPTPPSSFSQSSDIESIDKHRTV